MTIKKVAMAVSMLAMGLMLGCASGDAGEDKVAAWQKDRTPVEVLKSQIEVKAAAAIVEGLDVAPFGIYKAIADKVDGAATLERYRRIYMGYIADVKALEEKGTAHDAACKEVLDAVKAQPDGAETIAKLKEYLAQAQKTDFEAILQWIEKMTAEIAAALEKFTNESSNATSQLLEIAQKEGGMALFSIPKQGASDIAVVGQQLKDAGVGLKLYAEMISADREAAKVQAQYPVEG